MILGILTLVAVMIVHVLVNLIVSDIHLGVPVLARWLIRRHARKLPPEMRERYEPEWLAEIEAIPMHLLKMTYALGLFTGITDLVRAHGEKKSDNDADVTVTLTGVSADGSVGNLTVVDAEVIRVSDAVVAALYPATVTVVGQVKNFSLRDRVHPAYMQTETGNWITERIAQGMEIREGELRWPDDVTKDEPKKED
jgi:hypothetical protein